jgi:hypothetical protein
MRKSLRWSVVGGVLASAVALAFAPHWRAEAAETVDSPVAFEICGAEGAGAVAKCEALGLPAAYQVPAGRVLIVEQVSGSCGSDADPGLDFRAALSAQTNGVVVSHWIIGVTNPADPGGLIPLTLTKIYADPASAFTIGVADVPTGPGGRFCQASVSGRLAKP